MGKWPTSSSPSIVKKSVDSIKRKPDIILRFCGRFFLLFAACTQCWFSSGFLNLVTRPFGGFAGDWIYKWLGTKGKKYWTLFCGLVMGATFLAGGLYLENNPTTSQREPLSIYSIIKIHPISTVSMMMGIFSVSAIFSEFGNGANFALVPHCNSYNNVRSDVRSSEIFILISPHDVRGLCRV